MFHVKYQIIQQYYELFYDQIPIDFKTLTIFHWKLKIFQFEEYIFIRLILQATEGIKEDDSVFIIELY